MEVTFHSFHGSMLTLAQNHLDSVAQNSTAFFLAECVL